MFEDNGETHVLDIVSDGICPCCCIGTGHLGVALELVGDDILFDTRWRPFEPNPDMPRDGLNRKTCRSRKFGGWERSRALDAQVKQTGASACLTFHYERMATTPNTFASHVLGRLAGEAGLQDIVVEAIFRAYLTDGLAIPDPDVLADLAAGCGLDQTVSAHRQPLASRPWSSTSFFPC